MFHTLQINAAASSTATTNNNNTIYVCTSDGIDASSCGFNQTSPCKTIGYGIQQAPSNSTISIICGGSYVESSIRVSNKNLTIFNDATISSTSTASSIVDITCFNQVGPLFHFESSASRLIGLSISKCSLNGVPSNSSSNNSGGGGAVLVDPTATLEIVSCIFQDNSITIGYGGAVLSYGALRVIDSNFTDNYISTDGAANDLDQSPDTLQSYGGAIAIVLAHMPAFPIEISNSLFMRNAVIAPNERQDTNAINEIDRARSQSPARARAPLRRTTTSNTASFAESPTNGAQGGAVYLELSLGAATLRNSSFSANYALGGNSVRGTSRGLGGDAAGGAVYVSVLQASIELDHCTFNNNTAHGGLASSRAGNALGGAVALIASTIDAEIQALDLTFDGNRATGGSVPVGFEGVAGDALGGALYVLATKQFNATGGSFVHNRAIGGTSSLRSGDVQGGGACITGSSTSNTTLSWFGAWFAHNTAAAGGSLELGGSGFGGALSVLVRGSVLLDTCAFYNNSITGSSALEIAGAASGGALVATPLNAGVTVTLRHSSFFNNSIVSGLGARGGGSTTGGAASVALDNDSILLVFNCTFRANSAIALFGVGHGGALYVYTERKGSSTSTTTAVRSLQHVSIEQSVFRDNSVLGDACTNRYAVCVSGGAICQQVSTCQMEIESSDFMYNTVATISFARSLTHSVLGGAVISFGAVHVSGSNFTYNRVDAASGSGGGGAFAALSDTVLEQSTFANNSIQGNNENAAIGGAIVVSDSSAMQEQRSFEDAATSEMLLVVIDDELVRRIAAKPTRPVGANARMTRLQLRECQLYGNSASDRGGAVHVCAESCGITTENVMFQANRASFGGALALDTSSSLELHNDTVFLENDAQNGGGAIFIEGSVLVTPDICPKRSLPPLPPPRPPPLRHSLAARNDTLQPVAFENNTATYGPDCASAAAQLRISPSSKIVWPGQRFRLQAAMFDAFNNIVVDPATITQAFSNFTSGFHSGVPQDTVKPSSRGLYEFPDAWIASIPAVNPTAVGVQALKFCESSGDVALTTSETLHVFDCPAGYQPHSDNSTEACLSCPATLYSFDGRSCLACPPRATDGATVCMTPPKDDRPAYLVVNAGFWPLPSMVQPESIAACPNKDACLAITCSVSPNATSLMWQVDCSDPMCSGTDPNQPPTQDCYCAPGYTDRLCSRCACSATECYYASEKEWECEKCEPVGTVAYTITLALLLLSLVALYLLQQSSVILFLVEFVVVVIFVVFNLAEWWMFGMVLLLLVLYLVSNRSVPSGVVKTLLYYVQTANAIMPHATWPSWLSLATDKLNFVNFDFSGLECLSASLFATPVGHLLFNMMLPLGLALVIALAVVLGESIKWCYPLAKVWIERIRACYRRRCTDDTDAAGSLPRYPPSPSKSFHGATSSAGSSATSSNGYDHATETTPFRNGATSINSPDVNEQLSSSGSLRVDGHTTGCGSGGSGSFSGSTFPSYSAVNASSEPEEYVLMHEEEHLGAHRSSELADTIEWAAQHSRLSHTIRMMAHATLFLLYASQFELTNSLLLIFQPCPDGYMNAYPWIPCQWSNETYVRLASIGGLFFVFYGIGIPMLFAGLLYYNRVAIQQHDPEIERWIGFLYEDFRPDAFWFELVWIVRRTLISVAISLVPLSSAYQPALIVLTLLGSFVVQRQLMPFRSNLGNWLELASGFCLLYTYVAGVTFTLVNENATSIDVIQVVLVLANGLLLLAFIGALLVPSVQSRIKNRKLKAAALKDSVPSASDHDDVFVGHDEDPDDLHHRH